MGFDYLVELFKKFGNEDDTVYILDADSTKYIGEVKVKDLKHTIRYIKSVKGLASRGFIPKLNQFVNGFFIYCIPRYEI